MHNDAELVIQAWAETRLPPARLAHVRGVVGSADALARRYAPETARTVRIAAWLHDVARGWTPAELLAYAEAHGLPITPVERENPMLLHGAVGYALAAAGLGLDDPAVQSACRFHTVGDDAMNAADKIVFRADFIEPTRDYDGVEDLRAEAERGLDRAVLRAIDFTVMRLIRRQRAIDPRQLVLRNRLLAEGVRYSP